MNIYTWTIRKLLTLVTFGTWSVEKSTVHYKPLGIKSPEFTTSILWHEASKKPTVDTFSPFLIGMLGTRPKPLKGYPQWVKRGSGEQGRTRRSNPPTSGTLDCQFPSLTSWVPPISPFQKKYKAFLHNKFLPISPTSHPFRIPTSPILSDLLYSSFFLFSQVPNPSVLLN